MPTTPRKPLLSLRAYPEDYDAFHALRQQMQARLPFGQVTPADVLAMCVRSGTAAFAEGSPPVSISHPPTPMPAPAKQRRKTAA